VRLESLEADWPIDTTLYFLLLLIPHDRRVDLDLLLKKFKLYDFPAQVQESGVDVDV
jgi:hypothetical protein